MKYNDNKNDNDNMFISIDSYKYHRNDMHDINTSEKASNSKLTLMISMVKGAWSCSLWAPISVLQKKTFHFEGAENKKNVNSGRRMTLFQLH